jgi:hypothetical protein
MQAPGAEDGGTGTDEASMDSEGTAERLQRAASEIRAGIGAADARGTIHLPQKQETHLFYPRQTPTHQVIISQSFSQRHLSLEDKHSEGVADRKIAG